MSPHDYSNSPNDEKSLGSYLRNIVYYPLNNPWVSLALGLIIVLGVGFVTTRTVVVYTEHNELATDAVATVGAAEAVLLSAVERNSAQRGYILSADPAFLGRIDTEKTKIQERVDELEKLIPSSGVKDSSFARFNEALEERIEGFDEIEAMLAAGNLTRARQLSSDYRDRTDDLRAAVDLIKTEALGSLQERRAAADQIGDRAYLLTIAGLLSACALILAAIVLLSRRTNELRRANEEVQELAAGLEQRVSERTADLEEANEEIQRFAYIVSHDLRSPLVNVMGFTTELEDSHQTLMQYLQATPDVPDDVKQAVEVDMPEAIGFIRAATSRMDRLIKAILQISREGRRALAVQDINLDELFAGLVDSLSGQTSEKDAQITVGPLPSLESDPLALEQVFANLLDNAVKYLRPGVPGQIDVAGKVKRNRAIITITDNGRGVSSSDRARIFELFRRSGTQDQPGEGIGLAHVQALVRRLGGKIEVESELGSGSCFTVTLPLRMASRVN